MHDGTDWGTLFLVLALVAITAYLLPLIIAASRSHPNTMAIATLNILLGWTMLGWIAALVWALTAIDRRKVPSPGATSLDKVTKSCPFCAEPVLVAAIKCKHCGSDLSPSIAELATPCRPVEDARDELPIPRKAFELAVGVVAAIAIVGCIGWVASMIVGARSPAVQGESDRPSAPLNSTAQTASNVERSAPDLPAFPTSLEGSPSLELGQLVLMLMPAPGVSQIPWDHQANSAIVWRSSGYEDSPAGAEVTTSRNGLVRVNVEGVVSTVLHKRKEEMAWTVKYTSKSNPKFGVERIEISPGLIEEPCFGSTYSGCSFDPPSRSLADAGIKATELCKATGIGERGTLYRVEHADRQTMLLLWSTGGGSGGESSSIDLLVDHGKGDADAECARYKSTLMQPSAATEASQTTRTLS